MGAPRHLPLPVRRGLLVLLTVGLTFTALACAPEPDSKGDPTSSPRTTAPTASSSPVATPTVTASTSPTPSPAPTSTLFPVDVTLVTYDVVDGRLEATAIITDVVEDGGLCTLEARRGGLSRTAEIEAVSSATSTFCGVMSIPVSELAAGDWSIVVGYVSPTSSGSSAAEQLEVP